jgi:hypothetical protein
MGPLRAITYSRVAISPWHARLADDDELVRLQEGHGIQRTPDEDSQMAFEMFQDVILTVDLPAEGLCAGDVGTLVERHAVPGKEVGYSVEFFDMTGQTAKAGLTRVG